MGYGLGILLAVIGLILLLDVVDLPAAIDNNLDSNTLGWILLLAGILIVVLTLVTLTSRRRASTSATTTHPDGSQTVQRSSTQDPPVV